MGELPLYSVVPFVALLAAIALGPLLAPHWWEPNRNKLLVGVGLGLPVLALYLHRQPSALVHVAEEYVAFILLLAGLYTIAGGIRLTGDLEATPLTNTGFLAVGALLASFTSTTGASMLLIRPLLQTNRERRHVRHTVIFFVFLVSNIGGMLTPLGDPPLLLGYLQGVPFSWTFRLWPIWLAMVGALLLAYFVWDSVLHARESPARLRADRTQLEPLRLQGAANLPAVLGVVLAVALLGSPWREGAIVLLAGLSLWLTPRALRRANGFTFHPMNEVAALFLGIFLTMIPALELLRTRAAELGVREPGQFFWATGVLSAVLDNAPTYLAFLALAQGLGGPDEVVGVSHAVLTGISVGAVAMGACTYIGNAPNFMVKAIAESAGITMPTFLGYLRYTVAVLLPLFGLVTLVFFW
jgi:Na+/H+ antiporter NhaD/arsenite permease-like protein